MEAPYILLATNFVGPIPTDLGGGSVVERHEHHRTVEAMGRGGEGERFPSNE